MIALTYAWARVNGLHTRLADIYSHVTGLPYTLWALTPRFLVQSEIPVSHSKYETYHRKKANGYYRSNI
jgi:hypothetical protein